MIIGDCVRGIGWFCLLSLLVPTAAAAQRRPLPEGERSLVPRIAVDFRHQFMRCWRPQVQMGNPIFGPVKVKIELTREGRVSGRPVVAYPLAQPDHAQLAQAALRAVRKCAPLKIDPSYRAVYDRWKVVLISFDPTDGRVGESPSADGIPAAAISADRTSR